MFPKLHKELDIACEDGLGKVARSGFQHSKERVIIAEAFFNEKPNLTENHWRELVALIKDVGDLRTLKTYLKDWETPTGRMLSLFSTLKSLVSKEQISKAVDEATRQSKDTNDQEFLAALPEKVSKEPLLKLPAQDVMREVYVYFQEFMEWRLHKLYFRAHDIKQQAMHHQVDLMAKDQDQKRRMSSRSSLFEEIKMAQAQADQGYVSCCLWVYLPLKIYTLGSSLWCLSIVWRQNRGGGGTTPLVSP